MSQDNLLDDPQEFGSRIPKAKFQFISKLKAFLQQEKGPYILDQLTMSTEGAVYPETDSLNGGGKLQVDLDFEMDLIKMIHFDQFLADNFIRCFFRYYPKLPLYIKEVYLEMFRESQSLQLKENCFN